jgi:adhesin/invasin
VALSGTEVLVGTDGDNGSAGAANLYSESGTLLHTFTDPNGASGHLFGRSVALAGSDVLVGAFGFNGFTGAAYLYGQAAGISALFGNNQSSPVATPFGTLEEVQLIDTLGNPVSGATVTFTETDGSGAGAAFGGASTVTTNAQGIAYAPPLLANDSAGSFSVTAAHGSLATTFQLSNLPGPAAKLAVADAPARVTAGVPFSFQVDVEDRFGNLTSADHSLVAVTLSGGPGTFTAGMSRAQAVGGVAPFIDAVVQAASPSYVMSLSDGHLTGTTSGLTIVPAAPDGFRVVRGTPQNAAVGTTYRTALEVLVVDDFGNPVSGVSVSFPVVPASGAGGRFGTKPSVTVTTNRSGVATAPLPWANSQRGSFHVLAQVATLNLEATFTLTNH